jgi:hypothetical protein
MKRNRIIPFILIVTIAMLSFGPALAAPPSQATTGCPVDSISGTVVAVDPEKGTVTVDIGGGVLCPVNVNIDESHPITLLLGKYFGDFDPGTLTAELKGAVDTATICAIDNGNGTGTWFARDSEGNCPGGSEEFRVIEYDEVNGLFTAEPVGDGNSITLQIDDPEDVLKGALETLVVEWALESEGNLKQVSDQIALYHGEGMGFGVLVKLYDTVKETKACQQDPECTVDYLVGLFQSGGMGQIFKEYGKPDKVGVGHVRQAMDDKPTGQDKVKDKNKNKGDQTGDEQASEPAAVKKNGKPAKNNNSLKSSCNAVSKNGKPKKNATCP